MKISIKQLRKVVKEILDQNEAYNKELEDDTAYKEDSVLVPKDIKKSISRWSKKMGLSH